MHYFNTMQHHQSMPILRFEQFEVNSKTRPLPWEDKPSLIDDINDTMNRL